MVKVHIAKLHVFRLRRCSLSCIASEYDDIKQGVAHQTVSSVDSSNCLTCNEQVVDHFRKSVSSDLQTAVLIVECRIYKDRKFSHINVIVHVHTEHRRDTFLDRSRSADLLDHRSIKPYAASERCCHSFSALCTLTDDSCCSNVTGLKRMHESFTVNIDEPCAYGT